MISFQGAREKIRRHTPAPKMKFAGLREAFHRVLAQDLYAPASLPYFDNAAVDGYALGGGAQSRGTFSARGEVRAGRHFEGVLGTKDALRIFTGAPVPRGTYAVVMQEMASRIDGKLTIKRPLKPRENIRRRGEDIRRGEILLRKGTCLGPRHLGLLASVGMVRVPVFDPPAVAFFATGSELMEPGKRLRAGQIYDCNTILLGALLRSVQVIARPLGRVRDDRRMISRRIRQGLASDVLIVVGGVSVGEYDFVRDALEEEGVREIFWKVNVKPGKPLFFGKRGRTLVFGLPGNPVSVYVTFETLVKPLLFGMQGRRESGEKKLVGRWTGDYRNGPRTHFVAVHCRPRNGGYGIAPLKKQGSHRIGSLAKADGLSGIEPLMRLKKGQVVSVETLGG